MKEPLMEKAIAWVKQKPFETLRAKAEGYESPKIFTSQTTNEAIQADLSYTTRGGVKYFTDIALKNENPQKLVTKWKLLSLRAAMKRGKLFILAPKGHKMFAQELVKKYNINAIVYSI